LVQSRIFGKTLQERIKESRDVGDRAKLLQILQDAYDDAKYVGLEHLDLHMNNVIVDSDYKGHLIDWGKSDFVDPVARGTTRVARDQFDLDWWTLRPTEPRGTLIRVGGKTFKSLGEKRSYDRLNGYGTTYVADQSDQRIQLMMIINDDNKAVSKVVFKNGVEKDLHTSQYNRLKQVMIQLGYLRAFDDDEKLLAWQVPEGETLKNHIRRIKNIHLATKILEEAYQLAHQRNVIINSFEHVSDTLFVDSTTGAGYFGNLDYAIVLRSKQFTEKEVQEKFREEQDAVMGAWHKCVSQHRELDEFEC
jgi:hypothetical protein